MMRDRAEQVGGGVLVAGLGVLVITGWWWPGIMLVVGLALGAGRWMRGDAVGGVLIALILAAIPLAISVLSDVTVPWAWVIGLGLVAAGVVGILRGSARQSEHTDA